MYCLLAVLILLGKDNEIFLSIPFLWPNIRLKWFVAAIYLHDTALCWAVAGFQETIIPRHVKWTWSWKLVIFLSEIKRYIIIENDRLVSLQRSQKRRGRREVGGDTVRVWGRWWARSTRGSSCRDTGTSPSPSATGREAPPRISGTTVLMSGIMRVRKSWVLGWGRLQQQSSAMPW